MGFEAPSQLHGGDLHHLPSYTFPSLPDEPVGAPLEGVRQRLSVLVGKLNGLLGEHATPLLNEAFRQLEERDCRIAVIGQIKAGKSTFINSLIGQPGLLPTDINPWTAVVSALHFRANSTPPEHAAVFHLFSVDEWKQLATGSGRLRELTERLVPGFQPALLRAQLEVMRKRSERRLGATFEQLLGTCHHFKDITPQLLADYVSAGDPGIDAASEGQRRHYSDITRSADLYFNESPFAFPITLIDTPGTNDPFMVRDEITRRSLENPDIYIFVVSALQPLSAADIAMIRLLNGLHKDRIIVFINRVDQLANPAVEADIVRRTVKKRLRLEFPTLPIPVIIGSARLGNIEHETKQGMAGAAGQASPDLVAPPFEVGTPYEVLVGSQRGDTALRFSGAPATSSGIREVAAAITKMMCNSTIAMLLQQIASCLFELVRSDQASVNAQLQSMQSLFEAERTEASTIHKKIAEEQKALVIFEQRANALRASFEEMQAHFNGTTESGCTMMRNELRAIVREFALASADRLAVAIENGVSTKSWCCNVAPLRSELERAYLASFEQIAADIVRVEQFLYPHLQVIVANLLPGYQGTVLEAPASPLVSSPSLAPLTDKVTMDLELHWWTHWMKARRSAEERADQLRLLIEDDFLPIVDQLVADAEQRLSERVEYTMQRATAITGGLISGVEQRRSNLALEATLRNGVGDAQSNLRLESEHDARVKACFERQASLTVSVEELGAILTALDSLQTENKRQ